MAVVPAPAAAVAGDPHRPEHLHRFRLALEFVGAGVLVVDRSLGEVTRGLPHVHRAGFGDRLESGCRVDDVADHEAGGVASRSDARLTGEHAGTSPQVGDAEFFPESAHAVHEVEGGPHGPLGVVFAGDGCPPEGEDGVADELVDLTTESRHHVLGDVEVAHEHRPDFLGVVLFGEGGEPDEVDEEGGCEPACFSSLLRSAVVSRGMGRAQARPAPIAEAGITGVLMPAAGADVGESGSAARAEARIDVVAPATCCALHGTSVPVD